MKKYIILTAAFMLCLCDIQAQQSNAVSASIASKFSKQFSGAERIEWNEAGKVCYAMFQFENQTWLAYYDQEENLMATARQISEDRHLPLVVQQSLQNYREQQSAKSGPFNLGPIYELNQYGFTRYLVSMEGGDRQITFTIDSSGARTILHKDHKTPEQAATGGGELIARKVRRN
jgi:hypothetical protein